MDMDSPGNIFHTAQIQSYREIIINASDTDILIIFSANMNK